MNFYIIPLLITFGYNIKYNFDKNTKNYKE